MSNTNFEIRRDFLVSAQWDILPARIRQQIEELRSDPRPAKYRFEQSQGYCKIRLADGDEDIVVLYHIESDRQLIDLMEIRRTGALRKNRQKMKGVLDFIRELADFKP